MTVNTLCGKKSEKPLIRSGAKRTLMLAASAAGGGILAGAELICGRVPLAAALAACVSPKCGAAVMLGAAVRFLLGGMLSQGFSELCAVFLVTAFGAVVRKRLSPCGAAAVSASAFLISAVLTGFAAEMNSMYIIASCFRAMVCGITSFFMCSAAAEIRKGSISAKNGIGISIGTTYIIVSAAVISFMSFVTLNVGIAAVTAVTLCAVLLGRRGAAAEAGICAAMALALSGIYQQGGAGAKLACAAAAASVCAGAVCGRGRIAMGISFAASSSAVLLLLGYPIGSTEFILSACFGAAAFILMPDGVSSAAYSYMDRSGAAEGTGGKLMMMAETLNSSAKDALSAAKIFERRSRGYELSSEVCKAVCKNCRCGSICRHALSGGGTDEFRAAERYVKDKGHITSQELPGGFSDCGRKEEIAEYFCVALRRSNMISGEKRRLDAMRMTVCSDLEASAEIMTECAENIRRDGTVCRELSEPVRNALELLGAEEANVTVTAGRYGELRMEAYCRSFNDFDGDKVSAALSKIFGAETETAEYAEFGGGARICCTTFTRFTADHAAVTLCGREEVSGDSGKCFTDGRGRLYCILSDGMGSGGEAAAESSMAVSYLSRMLRAGISQRAAASYTNSLLLTKSDSEIFATADILSCDLFSGEAELCKFGAASTFLLSRGRFTEFSACTPPLGIMPDVVGETRRFTVREGDALLIMTDGIPEEIYPEVKRSLENSVKEGLSAECAASRIAQLVPTRSGRPLDDVTAAVIFF